MFVADSCLVPGKLRMEKAVLSTKLCARVIFIFQYLQVMGSLAMEPPEPGKHLQGILVKRNFNYHILAPSDLNSEF